MGWLNRAHDRDKWEAVMKMVMKSMVVQHLRNLLTS